MPVVIVSKSSNRNSFSDKEYTESTIIPYFVMGLTHTFFLFYAMNTPLPTRDQIAGYINNATFNGLFLVFDTPIPLLFDIVTHAQSDLAALQKLESNNYVCSIHFSYHFLSFVIY